MPHGQFPKEFYVKPFDTGTPSKLCEFVSDVDMELSHIVVSILKNGTSAGSESLQLKIYTSWDLTKAAYASSSARLLTATGAANNECWLGRLRFDFDRVNIEAGVSYYLVLETTSYTRSNLTYYLGAVLDWPDQVYTQGRSVPGAQIRLIGYAERDGTFMGAQIRLVQVAEGTVITAPSDVTVPAAASAIPLRFVGALAGSPVEEIDSVTGALIQRFTDGGSEKTIAFVKVPDGYVEGTQLVLLAAVYSRSTSNTILLTATSYLIQPDSDALSSTTNSYAATNTALTNAAPANRYRVASIDITNGSGQINGQTVEAGDTIRVEITRNSGGDTDTDDIRFIPDLTEVQYNA